MLDFSVFKDFCCKGQQYLIAKSGRNLQNEWLPVWAHLLDTAGIMESLLNYWVPDCIKENQKISNQRWKQVCIFLAMVHDIGKFTPLFQSNITVSLPERKEILEKWGLEIPPQAEFYEPGKTPHGIAGEAILRYLGCPDGVAAVVGAHHGRPLEVGQDPLDSLNFYEENFYGPEGEESSTGKEWQGIWERWMKLALQGCGYASMDQLPALDVPDQLLTSALLIMADWIASNTDYFPLLESEEKGDSLIYPQRVEEGWQKLSLPHPWIPMTYSFDENGFRERFGFSWNTVQQSVIRAVEESQQPGIFILEAQMGVGKTEAALAGAELLASKLGEGGIFFGLPTQATANGIFPRLKEWAERQSEWAVHSIRLAHGMAELNEDYQAIFYGHSEQNEDGCSSGLEIHPWFEGRKQALLSQFVIGTVDQLLMAALKQKHMMLRHLGLAGKVVIVDECHAYDAYMNRYLDRALNWMGQYRVPVILLSATLPAQRRSELICAYQNGGRKEKEDWQSNQGYPLLTWTDGDAVRQSQIPVDCKSRQVKLLPIEREELHQRVEAALSQGGCVGVVVNTVNQAQLLAQELEDAFPDRRVILIHSRFLMEDRTRREEELMKLLGKSSTPGQRKGLIVVGTQILEQSLDIDFDVLVTQICPMDLLLQRIGRLHRHKRLRPEGVQDAVCAVLDLKEPDNGTKAVYGRWLLYRTADLLPAEISLPEDIAPLVHNTYAEASEFLAEDDPAWPLWLEYKTELKKKEQRARQFRIPAPEDLTGTIYGLLDSNLGDGDWAAYASVRDGEPGVDVLVMVRDGSGGIRFLPWQHQGSRVLADHIPSGEECRNILRQRLQLPHALLGRRTGQTLQALEEIRQKTVPEWNNAPLLRGELFLFLNEEGKAFLEDYELIYTQKMGLEWKRKEKK